jgi:hypothetical protein
MAILNLLKGAYSGKMGVTVGAKWKDKNTLRVYTKPTYTDTPEQQIIRTNFGKMSQVFAAFSVQLKPYSALNTKGMSVRNALIHINKAAVMDSSIDWSASAISKGGLLPPSGLTASFVASSGLGTISWTNPTGVTYGQKAKIVVVAANITKNAAAVKTVDTSLATTTITVPGDSGDDIVTWVYIIDWRASSKIASASVCAAGTYS